MRSHSFAALAVLCATSTALVACGESVDVGEFEDGTGGAGGGELATTGASPDGPSTGPTTTAVGSGGDDTASSTSGTGGEDPAPNAFNLAALQQTIPAISLLAGGFVHGAFDDLECEDVATEGGCTLIRCRELDVEAKVQVDAGAVTMTTGTRTLSAENDSDSGYQAQEDGLFFGPGDDVVTVDVAGATDVPAFTAEVATPHTIDDAQAAADASLAPSGDDLTLTWTPVAPADRWVTIQRVFPSRTLTAVQCRVQGDEGSLVVPGSLIVAGIDAGEVLDTLVSVQVGAVVSVTAGSYRGTVSSTTATYAGIPCGGLGPDGENVCEAGQYCDWQDDSCGGDDGMGRCRYLPETCEPTGLVACACDGESYPSACEAAQHGVDVWGGEDFCPEAHLCGGFSGTPCAEDEFCDYEGASCGEGDDIGVCRARPTECPEPNADEVVCGCDFGTTFGSECLSNQAGLDIGPGDGLECGGA